MRFLLLSIVALLPQLSWGQLFGPGFQAGSYVLNDSRQVRHEGELKLRNGKQLLIKDASGKTLKLSPEQVSSFRLGKRKFKVIGDFHLKGGLGGLDVEKVFVEQLDSGQVLLLSYSFQVGTPASMGAGGVMMGGGAATASAYLLQWPDEETVTPAQGGAYSSGGKQFREAMRPFFNSRPDLLKLLEEKRITTSNLKEAVHALNNNLPFTPPASVVIPSSLSD